MVSLLTASTAHAFFRPPRPGDDIPGGDRSQPTVRERVTESPKVKGQAGPLFDATDTEFRDLVENGTTRKGTGKDSGHAIHYFTFDGIADGGVLALDWWIRQKSAGARVKELPRKWGTFVGVEGDDRGLQEPLRPDSDPAPRVFAIFNLDQGRGMIVVAGSCWAAYAGPYGDVKRHYPGGEDRCQPARKMYMLKKQFDPVAAVKVNQYHRPHVLPNYYDRPEAKDWAHLRRTNLFHVSTNGTDEVRFEAHAVNSLTEFLSSDMDFVVTRDSGQWKLTGDASDGYPAVSLHHYIDYNPVGSCVAYLKGGPAGDAAPGPGDRRFDGPVGTCEKPRS